MSSNLLYTGSTGARELTPRYEKRTGTWRTIRRWRGLKAEVLAIADSLSDPDATATQEDDVWWLLESSSPSRPDDPDSPAPSLDSQIVTLWSLQASRLSKSIWTLPKVAATFDAIAAGITKNDVTGIERAARFRADLITLAKGEEIKVSVDPKASHDQEVSAKVIKITWDGLLRAMGSWGVNLDLIRDLFLDLYKGVDSYPVDAFVLKKRSVAPNGANLRPAYTNTNRAISTATLLSDEPSISSTLRTGLPDGYWFKAAPIVDETDPNRFEVVQEWTHADDFSRFIYGNPL